MICGRHDRHKNHARIPQPNQHIHAFPEERFADFTLLERAPEDTGVVEHGAADDEGVAEMHRRHGGEGVDVIAAHPDGRCVIVADGVEETVLWREEPGRHARVQGEGREGEKVC